MTKFLHSLCVFGFLLSSTFAGVPEIVKNQVSDLESFYKDIHKNPELSGQEVRTAGKVAEEFRRLKLEVLEKIGGNGVVGILRNGPGTVTLVRAELDALPIEENTKLPYSSQVKGVMHACGHDFHLMSLVGAARVMSEIKDEWKGTIVFLAQPSEETVKGAQGMIKDGLFKKIPKPDYVLALHSEGNLKKGVLGITSGYAFAAGDSVEVIFHGKGTHGSKPEKGIDPFIQMAEFVLKMQTLIGREKSAFEPAVISVGSVHGGTKSNIIPEEVKLQLTLRTYDPDLRKYLKTRIQETAEFIAKSNRAPKPVVTFPEGVDPLYNSPELASRAKEVLKQRLGHEAVIDTKPLLASEDLGYFGAEVRSPSLLIWVGQKNDKDPMINNHSPLFYPDLKATAPLAIQGLAFVLLDFQKQ